MRSSGNARAPWMSCYREKEHVNPVLIRNAQHQLDTDTARLRALDDQIAVLAAHPVSGLVNDDTQPFPVFGWLEIGYLPA